MATLTEQIRQALARRDGVPEEAMRTLAESYSAEVTRVNERLSKAVAMLHKGLRSEAIQMASLAPNAIDAAAALDFPEFDEWCEILQFFGIPTPAELQRDLADQLNEAIVESQPLDGALRQHRRLAIARAPLSWRLKTLRRIAEIDPTNSVWEEDLEIWETARIKQLDGEVAQAVAAKDQSQLAALHQELSQTGWRIEPGPALGKKVAAALQRACDASVAMELTRIAPLVHEAFCQFDEPAARQALADWDAAAARSSVPPSVELAEQVDGAAEWIKQIDREAAERRARAAAVGKLQSALDHGASRTALDAAYNACGQFDEPPPDELVERYRLAVEHTELAAKRRNQAILVAIAACTLIAVGSIIYWQRSALYERSVADAESSLLTMLDSDRIVDAQAFWTRLESDAPQIAGDLRLVSLLGKLETMVADESARTMQFAEYLQLAAVNDPAQLDRSSLAKAEGLAVSEDEKAAAFKVRRLYSQWDHELEGQQTTALLADTAKIRKRLDEVESLSADAVPAGEIADILSQLDDLRGKFPRAGTAAKSQITSTRTRATAIRDTLRQRRERIASESAAMARIVKSSSLDQLSAQLTAYSQKSPNSPLSKEFSQVASERAHWDQPQAWNSFAASVADALEKPFVTAVVNDLSKQQTLLRAKLGENPAEQSTGPWADRLDRYAERQTALKQVLGELSDTVIADLYTVIEGEGAEDRHFVYHFYYDRNRTLFSQSRRSLETIVNASGAVSVSEPLTGPFKVDREPHATIQWLTGVYRTSAGEFGKDWDREFLKLIGQLRNRSGLDRQLKEMLIQHLLAGACEGSERLSKELIKEVLLLRDRATQRDHWFEPTDLTDKLDEVVESIVIKKVAELYRTLPDISAEPKRLRLRQYTWVGCLTRDASGTLMASLKTQPQGAGQLVVAGPTAGTPGKTDMVVVGDVKAGRPTLSGGRTSLIAGRPLFFFPD